MILSHRAPSSFNMSRYLAIWTRFRFNSMISPKKMSTGPGPGPGPGPGLGPGHFFQENNEIGSEMGPYGSIWAHIKTGRSPMAQDHFQTTPDPQNNHGRIKIQKEFQINILPIKETRAHGKSGLV